MKSLKDISLSWERLVMLALLEASASRGDEYGRLSLSTPMFTAATSFVLEAMLAVELLNLSSLAGR